MVETSRRIQAGAAAARDAAARPARRTCSRRSRAPSSSTRSAGRRAERLAAASCASLPKRRKSGSKAARGRLDDGAAPLPAASSAVADRAAAPGALAGIAAGWVAVAPAVLPRRTGRSALAAAGAALGFAAPRAGLALRARRRVLPAREHLARARRSSTRRSRPAGLALTLEGRPRRAAARRRARCSRRSRRSRSCRSPRSSPAAAPGARRPAAAAVLLAARGRRPAAGTASVRRLDAAARPRRRGLDPPDAPSPTRSRRSSRAHPASLTEAVVLAVAAAVLPRRPQARPLAGRGIRRRAARRRPRWPPPQRPCCR